MTCFFIIVIALAIFSVVCGILESIEDYKNSKPHYGDGTRYDDDWIP